MPQSFAIQNSWVNQLFQNQNFKNNLKQFFNNQQYDKYPLSDVKVLSQINAISEDVSMILFNQITKQSQKRFDIVAQEINKISTQITNLKNTFFGCNEKVDLETTYYNKSRLQISSILEQDIGYDASEVKSSLVQIQQRFNEWFGSKFSSEQFNAADNLNESKLCQFISKKCHDNIQLTQKRMLKRFQTSDLLTQRRIQQLGKTLNNVLQMLNEANNKKSQFKDFTQSQTNKHQINNQPSLMRQSSLQNLKIKSFFNFGNK